jgi:hypothetical protein
MATIKRRLGLRYASGVAVVAALIATAVLWKSKKPVPESPVPCPSVTCPAPPKKGDKKCEPQYGEADPESENFDPKSCGYCGDEVRQVKAEKGSDPYMDPETRVWMQDVNGRESETAEECPVDFHCGNKRLDVGRPFGAFVQNDDGVFSTGLVAIMESCAVKSENYCPADCGRRRGKKEVEVEEPDEPLQRTTFTCPSQIASQSASDVISAKSLGAGNVLGRIAGAVRQNSTDLRTALAVDPADDLKVVITMTISPAGNVSIRALRATCNNESCGNHSTVRDALSLDLSGLTVGSPGRECWWTVAMKVPE